MSRRLCGLKDVKSKEPRVRYLEEGEVAPPDADWVKAGPPQHGSDAPNPHPNRRGVGFPPVAVAGIEAFFAPICPVAFNREISPVRSQPDQIRWTSAPFSPPYRQRVGEDKRRGTAVRQRRRCSGQGLPRPPHPSTPFSHPTHRDERSSQAADRASQRSLFRAPPDRPFGPPHRHL